MAAVNILRVALLMVSHSIVANALYGCGPYGCGQGIMTVKGTECIFPFTFNGVEFTKCADGVNHPYTWCATSISDTKYGRAVKEWEICNPANGLVTSAPFTEAPPATECKDTVPVCSKWPDVCTDPETAKTLCPKTCGLCKDGTVYSDQCGIANSESLPGIKRSPSELTRIYGGVEVNPQGKYPWQVGLINSKIVKPFFCGGSIISNRWILTAAHCIIDYNSTCEPHPWHDGLHVRVGEHNQVTFDENDLNTRNYEVSRYVIHPGNACPYPYGDIALLELSEEIPFNDAIRPVCLPKDDSKTYAGEQATLSGWGEHSGGEYMHVLMEVEIPIVAQTECRTNISFDSTMLCTGALPDKSGCFGDSGGPLVVQEGNRYVLVGVVHGGDECGSSTYSALYARVSKFLNWINFYSSKTKN